MDAASLLRRCREQSGLTQRQLAAEAGTSAASICLYESGERIPRTDTLTRLIAATGASVRLGATLSHAVDPKTADRAFQAALSLTAALPYQPSDRLEAVVFSSLAK